LGEECYRWAVTKTNYSRLFPYIIDNMADKTASLHTGTIKYSKEFSIPPEFPDILTNLTREILRAQPKDIDKFGSSQP
jgi:hypothetical protein